MEHLTETISFAMNETIPKKCFIFLDICLAEKKRLRRAYFRHKFKGRGIKMEIDRLDKAINDNINARDSEILMSKLKQIRPDNKMFRNINKLLGGMKKVVPELISNCP